MPTTEGAAEVDAASPRELPKSARGIRTRASLIAASRVVFERDGFLDARLVDITSEAQVAIGSFYTHFSSKEEIFMALLESVKDEMLHPRVREMQEDDDPIAVIEASNRAYLLAYKRNHKLMGLLEQVAPIDDRVREFRRRRNDAFTVRNSHSIEDLQRRGLADPTLDPLITAHALSSMVSRMAYNTYVIGGNSWSTEQLVSTLTTLWANALRLPIRR